MSTYIPVWLQDWGVGGVGVGLAVWLHGEVYICVWLEYRKRGGGSGCTEWGCILIWLQDRKWVGVGGWNVIGYVQVQSEVCIPLCVVAGA